MAVDGKVVVCVMRFTPNMFKYDVTLSSPILQRKPSVQKGTRCRSKHRQ